MNIQRAYPAIAGFLFGLAGAEGAWADPSTFRAQNAEVDASSATSALITLTREGDLQYNAAVRYATADGSATAGVDYGAARGTAVFPGHVTTMQLSDAVYPHPGPQADKQYKLKLISATGIGSWPAFAAPFSPPGGEGPSAVLLADVNLDGRPDLVAANRNDNTLSVRLNNTPPGQPLSYAAPVTFAAGNQPAAAASADFNGDGKPDFAVASQLDGTVTVFLNATTLGAAMPAFAPAQAFATAGAASAITAGDANNDGKPDLLVANASLHSVSVLIGATAPGATAAAFDAAASIAAGDSPRAVALGDLNGDGKPELVVGHQMNKGLWVYRNITPPGAAAASFGAPKQFAVQNICALAIGDLNGDGKPDLGVGETGPNAVALMVNRTETGDAAITLVISNMVLFGTTRDGLTLPVSLAIADVNIDGKPDLMASLIGADRVAVLINLTTPLDPLARLEPGFTFATGTQPGSLAVGDADGDGLADLITANFRSNNVSVLLNQTTLPQSLAQRDRANLAAAADFPLADFGKHIAAADFNGDGKPDLVATDDNSSRSSPEQVSLLINSTAGGAATPTFLPYSTAPSQVAPSAMAVAELNGDGRPDILIASYLQSGLAVMSNTMAPGAQSASFATGLLGTDGFTTSVAGADLNGDGKTDVIAAANTTGKVDIFLNATAPGAAQASFMAMQAVDTGSGSDPHLIIPADINGDGRLDLVVGEYNPQKTLLLINTTPPGAAICTFTSTLVSGYTRAVADLNGDGLPDLLMPGVGTLTLLRNTSARGAGAARFAAPQTITIYGTYAQITDVAGADFDHDGKADVILAASMGWELMWNTTPVRAKTFTFRGPWGVLTDQPQAPAVADFNGDGLPDLAMPHSQNAAVFLNERYRGTVLGKPATITLHYP